MLLITGASGRIGGRTAQILSATGKHLRLMSREPEKIPKVENAEPVRGEFADRESLDAAFRGIDTALVISGSAPPGKRAELHKNAFEAATRAKVSHVIYLSLQGASHTSCYPYSCDHRVSEEYLVATGLRHTILRDSFYFRMFNDLFDEDGVMRGAGGEGRGAFVSAECVARTAAAELLAPKEGTYDVTGRESLSLYDVARRLAAVLRRDLKYEPESADEMRQRLKGQGMPDEKIALQVGWFQAIEAGEIARPSDTVRQFTGNVPLSIEAAYASMPETFEKLRTHGR